MENDEQIKQACYLAVLRYFELDPVKQYRPLFSTLRLTEAERARYTHKFYVMIADQGAIVYRAGPGGKWRECSTIFEPKQRKSARMVGIEYWQPEHMASEAACSTRHV